MSVATGATTGAIGEELLSPAGVPTANGRPPWEREGGSHIPPTDARARRKAEQWQTQVASEADGLQRRMNRRRERLRRKEQREQERAEKLVKGARQMFVAGFFMLPMVWLMALFYFHREHKDENANPEIRRCEYLVFRILSLSCLNVPCPSASRRACEDARVC